MTAPISGLHHAALKARQPARLAAFYRDVLGLEETARHVDESGLRSVWLRLGDGLLMIERSDTPADPPGDFDADPPGLHLLAYRIRPEDRQSWARRLSAHGLEIAAESPYSLYVRDPEGHRFALSHWPELPSESLAP